MGGDRYDGGTYKQLKSMNYVGYADYYLCNKETDLNPETISQLIEIDLKSGADIDDIVSYSWLRMRSVDDGNLLKKILDKFPTPYNKTSKILWHELDNEYF